MRVGGSILIFCGWWSDLEKQNGGWWVRREIINGGWSPLAEKVPPPLTHNNGWNSPYSNFTYNSHNPSLVPQLDWTYLEQLEVLHQDGRVY